MQNRIISRYQAKQKEGIYIKDNQDRVCNLCSHHCSVENLQCERGRNYSDNNINTERTGEDMKDNHEVKYESQHDEESHKDHHGDHHMSQHHEENHKDHHDDHHDDHHEDHHHGNHHGNHHDEDHHDDDQQRKHHHEDHRGAHERHGNHEMFFRDNKEDNLLSLLDRSGHFMHHKRGGKRGQSKILLILAEHPEISQKELQELLGIESGSMSEIVIKLEHKGLIIRAKDETDKRMTKLMITDLGMELSKEIEARETEDDKLLFGALTEEEQEQLKALLKKMLQGWEENYAVIRESRHCHADGVEHCHKGGKRHHRFH